MRVTVVIPSRGRPERARVAIDALRSNARKIATSIVLGVDEDDPKWIEYRALEWPGRFGPEVHMVTLKGDETGNLVRATNTLSLRIAEADPDCIIGNLGDDHVCQTDGWDVAIAEALSSRPGIAYGDDLLQGEKLPTAPFISASIVRALGWFALPVCSHMFIDDAWKALGKELDCLTFLSEVVIEHVHPGAAKAEWDEGYTRADESTDSDAEAFYKWRNTTFYKDVERVRASWTA